jgi:paraquat-inducible protein A
MSSKYDRTYQSFNSSLHSDLYDDDESRNNSPATARSSLLSTVHISNMNSSPDNPDQFSSIALLPSKYNLTNVRQYLAISLTILSLIFLYPGLTVPIFTIRIAFLNSEVLHQTRSIVGTIQYLHENQLNLAALLITTFSIIVPILKSILFLFALFHRSLQSIFIMQLIRNWSKWAMNDVFCVAIFVAYLSTSSAINVESHLEEGFYYFLIYCLLGLISQQIAIIPTKFNNNMPQYSAVQ